MLETGYDVGDVSDGLVASYRAWLSGSGPTVAALCSADLAQTIAGSLGADGHTKILQVAATGATLHQ